VWTRHHQGKIVGVEGCGHRPAAAQDALQLLEVKLARAVGVPRAEELSKQAERSYECRWGGAVDLRGLQETLEWGPN
jgi:hypothetical protein